MINITPSESDALAIKLEAMETDTNKLLATSPTPEEALLFAANIFFAHKNKKITNKIIVLAFLITDSIDDTIPITIKRWQNYKALHPLWTGLAMIIKEAVAPFEWPPEGYNITTPSQYGVLLIHGLLDSCFIMRDIGQSLYKEGYFIKSILLPGHGLSPDALLSIRATQWINAVKLGIDELKSKKIEKIILVGFSLGGLLALLHTLHDNHIAGIVCLAPACKIRSWLAKLTTWQPVLGHHFPSTQWLSTLEECDPVKYRSTPTNAVNQVYQLTQLLKKESNKKNFLACPIFFIASAEDSIICSKTALNYFMQNQHSASKAILYSSKLKKKQTYRHDHRIEVRNSYLPEYGIMHFSHICLPVAPHNSHYGNQGDYIFASHINPKNWHYGETRNFDETSIILRNKFNIKKMHYGRLTFNPDFEYMIEKIKEFIKTL